MKITPQIVACAALLYGLSACGGKTATPSTNAAPAAKNSPATPATPTDVTLSAESQLQAGIRTEAAELNALASSVTATGQVMPNEDRTFRVGAHVAGKVAALEVNLGDRVTSGQVLLRMHSHEIHDTRGAYLVAREAVRQMQDKSAYAQRVRDRARRLLALDAISKEQADQAETEWTTSLATVDSAKAELERERTHLEEVLEVPIDKSGIPKDIDTVPIRSPAAGIVIERKATAGTVASAGDVLLTITDPSSLWVIANINEAELSSLRPGQVAAVQVRAYPDRTFTGRIEKLGEALDPATRTLQVRIVVPNSQGLLKPEMFTSVSIKRDTGSRVITVPRSAIQDVNGQPSVFIETSNRHFRPQAVVTGISADDRIEIVRGISPGDRVVVEGSFGLKSELLKSSLQEN